MKLLILPLIWLEKAPKINNFLTRALGKGGGTRGGSKCHCRNRSKLSMYTGCLKKNNCEVGVLATEGEEGQAAWTL